jgi:endonuclease YncB( thermonuclease family)
LASSPFLSLLLIWLLLAAPALAAPHPWRAPGDAPRQAVVAAIGDGDSLHLRAGEQRFTVRLACIDAPELAQAPQGPASHRYLLTRAPRGSRVRLIPHDIDRYGRLVAEVIGSVNLNLALVEDGQAFVDPRHVRHCDAQAYRDAETRAERVPVFEPDDDADTDGIWHGERGSGEAWSQRSTIVMTLGHPGKRGQCPPSEPRFWSCRS